MIVKLFDRTEITVTKDQAEKIKQAIDAGAEHLDIRGTWVRVSAIAMIKPGGAEEADKSRTLPERTVLTDEDHAKARKKIAEIRDRYFNKSKT